MKLFNRICAVFLVVLFVVSALPLQAMAANTGNEYSISNDFVRYSINSQTGGFCIETKEGHPQKSFDNNIPLLYKEDTNRSNGTSFTTVRIDGKDYIFGQDYGWFGIDSKLSTPIVSDEGRLITVTWTIKGYSITQKVAISVDENNNLCGNVGLSYEVTNNNTAAGKVGIRVMLDAALDNQIDAPYVVSDANLSPTIVETEFSKAKGNLPQQIRFMDSISNPSKMAYALLSGWSGTNEVVPDKVIVGHWANLANTRYNYTTDPSCDFSNYSNKYRIPDTAAAFFWSEASLDPGKVRTAELLYGIGNFSSELTGKRLGLDMTCGSIQLDATGKAYQNGGDFKVNITLDNSVDGARNLISPIVKVSLEDGLTFKATGTREYTATYEGGIAIGSTKTLSLDVVASPQYQITSRRVVVAISGTEYVDENTNQLVEYSANRNVLIPAAGGILPDIQMTQISPDTVYYDGDKNITISGDMSEFSALAGSTGWDLYLISKATGKEIRIDKKNIAFTDNTFKTMSFSTNESLTIGIYNIVFKFTDIQLKSSFGSKVTAAATLNVSADESYRSKSYGLVALVRFDSGNKQNRYDFFSFANEDELQSFTDGNRKANGLIYSAVSFDKNSSEVLEVVRGKLREMTDNDGNRYFQANTTDGDVTINNILAYCGVEPLTMRVSNNSGSLSDLKISGDGTIKVINSINIWHNKWSFHVTEGMKYTLDSDAVEEGAHDLELSLDGAGTMLQYIGGFLIDLKYGVMTYSNNLYGVSFGGKITLPIKAPKDKKSSAKASSGSDAKEDDKDDGEISAAINSILYGERSDKPVGFVGIDATFKVGLPSDVLGSLVKNSFGVEAEVTINTIDNYYRLQVGVEVVVFECEGIIALKQVPIKSVDRIVPDEIFFKISGDIMQIPIVPPFVFMTGIGGGISGLADTMSDELQELPPITLKLYTQLLLVETLTGDFDLSINLSGMELQGELKLVGDDDGKIMKINGGLKAHWVAPFSLSVYGNMSVCAGLLKGGFTITISDDYFYGYVFAGIYIPDPIPFVGGKEIASVEAAVSSDFIGANIKIIGIKFGVIYYWDGDYHFGKGIDLSSRGGAVTTVEDSYINEAGQSVEYAAAYGTNMRRLTSSKVSTTKATGATIIKNFDPSTEDALMLEVPFNGVYIPTAEEITLVSPNGTSIPIVPDDGNGNGNFLVQDRGEDGKYIYLTVTDKNILVGGNWTLTVNTKDTVISNFEVNGVDNLPELTGTDYEHSADNSKELKVSWTTDSQSDSSGVVDVYLTKNADALDKLHKSDTGADSVMSSISRIELDQMKSGSAMVQIPDSFADGTYYVVTMLSQNEGGMSAAISKVPFAFINDSLPKSVKNVSVVYGGNGNLKIDATDADQIGYNYYLISILDENKNVVKNGEAKIAVGSPLLFGSNADVKEIVDAKEIPGLIAGKTYYVSVQTLNQTEDNYYYGTDAVLSEAFVMPQASPPTLLSVSSNISDVTVNTNTTSLEATYTFDQPVAFTLSMDGSEILSGSEYKTVWTVKKELEDGAHAITFTATNTANDAVTGDYFPTVTNALLGFTVDSQAPVLTLGEKTHVSLDKDAGNATVSNQTVFMDQNGHVNITGLTEAGAILTFDDSIDGVTIKEDGTFVIDKTFDTGSASLQKTLKAVDKAGNATTLLINIVNSELATYQSLSLLSDVATQVDSTSGVRYIEMSVGETVSLTAFGHAGQKQVAIGNDNIEWKILYDQNIITFHDGSFTATAPGETAVRGSFNTATYDADGMTGVNGTVSGAISDVIVIRVTDPGYRYNLIQTRDYTLISITAQSNLGALTVTIDGKTTLLLYDAKKKAYVGAFSGTLSSATILNNLQKSTSHDPTLLVSGDFNNDATTDNIDLEEVIQTYLNGTLDETSDANTIVRSDVNGDHVIDLIDAQLILLGLLSAQK